MTDYRYIYSSKLKQRNEFKAYALFALLIIALGIVGHFEQEPVEIVAPVAKSRTQEQIETILPEPVAKAIAERTEYPLTMASIAHTESGGGEHAIGDGGKAKGLFQVWGSLHGRVPDDIEGQVDQANKMFLELVRKHGYRTAVSLWNGTPDNPKVKQYQRVVLAKVQALESRQ